MGTTESGDLFLAQGYKEPKSGVCGSTSIPFCLLQVRLWATKYSTGKAKRLGKEWIELKSHRWLGDRGTEKGLGLVVTHLLRMVSSTLPLWDKFYFKASSHFLSFPSIAWLRHNWHTKKKKKLHIFNVYNFMSLNITTKVITISITCKSFLVSFCFCVCVCVHVFVSMFHTRSTLLKCLSILTHFHYLFG